jgi:hypothetical protein
MAAGGEGFLGRYFYVAMAVLLAAVVGYGFSHTIEENLLHPSFPRPAVLYVHAAVFGGWMVLLLVQTSLVAVARKTAWHRRLGWLGVALGCAVPVLGTISALRMTRLRYGFGDIDDVAFLILALSDMAVFAALFGLAIALRGREPEAHRRLMLMATALICVAALTRFPPWLPAPEDQGAWAYYAYADGLVALGILRDGIVVGRLHWVYRRVFPAVIALQAVANAVYMTRPAAWMNVALWLIR